MTSREDAIAHGENAVHVERVFNAPREAVFRAWIEPQQWAQWFAPQPMTVPRAETDPRPGGRYTFVMRDEEGNEYPSTGEYREVVEPERIVYTDSSEQMPEGFVDMLNDARGMPHGTPVQDGVTTVTFEDVGAGRTRLVFHEEFDSKATRDAWVEMQMVEGLDEGFDNLERLLERAPTMAT